MPEAERQAQVPAAPDHTSSAVGALLFVPAVALIAEAGYARLGGPAPAGSTDYRKLLVLAGLLVAIIGLLTCLRHWSVASLARRSSHPRWDGLIVLCGGAGFATLYAVALNRPVSLTMETLFLMALLESIVLLWLAARWMSSRPTAAAH